MAPSLTRPAGRRPRHGLAVAAAALLLTGCGTAPPVRTLACSAAPPAQVSIADGVARTQLSVLTYNVEGLGWPARRARAPRLHEIGAHLAALNAKGRAPDVVMIQEMFSGAAKRAVAASGYPAIASGPRRTTPAFAGLRERLPGKARAKRGEIGLRLTGGGLAIASVYPIVATEVGAFGRRSCAGIDCLANKGVMLARIAIPGVPVPVALYNTHMNSQRASRAPDTRHAAAHDRQAREASLFIGRTHRDAMPLVFGGDFNMRQSATRWENFSSYQALALVHQVCAAPQSDCDVRLSWDGDAPWMDTQDLQFFDAGDQVSVRPVRVEAMFDGGPQSPKLSDHDGLLVTYELSWPAGAPVARSC